MTKLQRIRKINRENKSLTASNIRKYEINNYTCYLGISKTEVKEFKVLDRFADEDIDRVVKIFINTTKWILSLKHIVSYFMEYGKVLETTCGMIIESHDILDIENIIKYEDFRKGVRALANERQRGWL